MKTNVKKEEKLLNVGILGCGIINQAAHLIGSTKARNIHLHAICDASEELRHKMAAIYDPEAVYKDYGAMLADPKVDAIIIGVGDQFHMPCAKQAILAGKHVFVEKPMGVSIEECQEVKKLAEEKGVFLQVGHMKRYDEGLQYAKKFKEEKMGEITTYKGWYCDSVGRYTLTDNVMPVLYSSDQARKPAGNPKAILDHYYLLGHGSHLFDTAFYFMGDIESVSARYVNREKLHSWLIDVNFENGAIGTLDLSIAIAQKWHEGCEIYGTGGTVFAKTYNPWEFRSSEVECYDRATDMITMPAAYDGQFYRRELEGFADTILKDMSCTGATADDGIKVMKALIATYQSVHSGGAWVKIADVKGEL
ncbi:MAG: Gfo/Idh/MocA family oxidoreductase [Robinsoniella sp.]|nr:Gfo/Idh/MocA family oxidoreductase [Robinsoniella sp.]